MSATRTEMSVTAFRDDLREILNRVEYTGTHVVVMRHSKPSVAVVPISVLETLLKLEDKFDLEALATVLNDPDENWTDDEEFWEELGI